MSTADTFYNGVLKAVQKGKDTHHTKANKQVNYLEVLVDGNKCRCLYYDTHIATVEWDDDKIVTEVIIESFYSTRTTIESINAIVSAAVSLGFSPLYGFVASRQGYARYMVPLYVHDQYLLLPLVHTESPFSISNGSLPALHKELDVIRASDLNGVKYTDYSIRKRDFNLIKETYIGSLHPFAPYLSHHIKGDTNAPTFS